MNKLITWIYQLKALIEGKKTYLIATATTILNVVVVLYPNLLTTSQILKINAILIALGGAALRASISRV